MHNISHPWRWLALLVCTLIMLAAYGSNSRASSFEDSSEFLPTSQELTLEMAISAPYKIEIDGGGTLTAIQPSAFDQPFDRRITVRNSGLITDSYIITTNSRLGWANFAAVPAQITLAPSQRTSFLVRITLPKPLDPTLEEEIVVMAQSTKVSNLSNDARITIRDPHPMRSIRPVLECVADNGDGTYTAYFGYNNENPFTVQVPIGNDNMFTPTPQNRGQPTSFAPGYQRGIFSVVFKGNTLVWRITNAVNQYDTATASRTSVKCGLATGVLSITII